MTLPEDPAGWVARPFPSFQPHREHRIQAGETLDTIAAQYQLSGWQGLYYAAVNERFRHRHPNPRSPLPLGEQIGIPCAAEQQIALSQRIQGLHHLAIWVQPVFQHQETWVLAISFPSMDLGEATRSFVRTTLEAIHCLQAPEYAHNQTAIALTEDALARWSLHQREECASLLSLLERATRNAPWILPEGIARNWCDPSSPNFWAKPFLAQLRGLASQTINLRQALQSTRSQILQSIDRLRTEAIMERNRLARLQEAALAAENRSERTE